MCAASGSSHRDGVGQQPRGPRAPPTGVTLIITPLADVGQRPRPLPPALVHICPAAAGEKA